MSRVVSRITGSGRVARRLATAAAVLLAAWTATSATLGTEQSYPIDVSIQPAGTVSFKLHTDQTWANGSDAEKESITFLKISGMAEVTLQQTGPAVGLGWRWLDTPGAPSFRPIFSELPGSETWFLQFTWDAERGLSDFYVNGLAMKDTNEAFSPWKFEQTAIEAIVPDGPFTVSDLEFKPTFFPPEAARKQVPKRLLDRRAEVFGLEAKPAPMSIDGRRGAILYQNPLAAPDDVGDWVMEGPGRREFEDGWMKMWSTRPDAAKETNGHIVFWCPKDFPDSFVAEWEVQLLEDYGLTIVFFAAKGAGGEDVFDSGLPKRDGTFTHYIRGAVNSYHVSYYASTPGFPGRATANLRKNNNFYLVASGPVAIRSRSRDIHRIRLIKDGPHIQFQTDGRVIIDYTDPGSNRYGPVYGGGKMALRQMQWTVGRYRNFQVTELLTEK